MDRCLWGLSPGARDLVEWLQPYKRGDATLARALGNLDEFANMNKHRFLPLALGEPFLISRSILPFAPLGAVNVFTPGPLHHGAQIARVRFPSPQPQVKVDLKFVFNVLFDEPTPIKDIVTKVLSEMALGVSTVVDWFSQLVTSSGDLTQLGVPAHEVTVTPDRYSREETI
jgi:hypothetical protein